MGELPRPGAPGDNRPSEGSITPFPACAGGPGRDVERAWWLQKLGLHHPHRVSGARVGPGLLLLLKKSPILGKGSQRTHYAPATGKCTPSLVKPGPSLPQLSGHAPLLGAQFRRACVCQALGRCYPDVPSLPSRQDRSINSPCNTNSPFCSISASWHLA